MTNKKNDYKEHTTFGGLISEYSFTGHTSIASVADGIMCDRRFDRQCRKNIRARKRHKKYINRTEDL